MKNNNKRWENKKQWQIMIRHDNKQWQIIINNDKNKK